MRTWQSVKRARAEEEVRRQGPALDTALSHSADFISMFDLEGRVTFVNHALLSFWNISLEDAVGKTLAELDYPSSLAAKLQDQIEQVTATGDTIRDEMPLTDPSGILGIYQYIFVPIPGENGKLIAIANCAWNVTDLRESEHTVRASLAERETLLKEIHHRVKNNLQVIISLLNLQANQLPAGSAQTAFRDTQSRVLAIARIHETLYSSSDLSEVEFGHYARVLIQDVLSFYGASDTIRFVVETEDMVLDIDQAVPLGLILNELVTNSLKHAFPDVRAGTISMSLRYIRESVSDDQPLDEALGCLKVEDDGIGLGEGFDFDNSNSMGMYLMRILARQLRGSIQFHAGIGTSCTLTFPVEYVAKDKG